MIFAGISCDADCSWLQVFTNAKQYNADGSEVYDDAVAMQRMLEMLAQEVP